MMIIDKVIFGDNQFFGINHMSQQKAQELAIKFADISNIIKVYDQAFNLGVRAVMLNTNERAGEICDYFKKNKSNYAHINWYPSIPYPHKYANLVTEKGVIGAIIEIVRSNGGVDLMKMVHRGTISLVSKDIHRIMEILIDMELKPFIGLNIKVVFLQNIVTDLLLGMGIKDAFMSYCNYIKEKYRVLPGFITQNLPLLKDKLKNWNIKEVVICTSFNKLGYFMSPNLQKYIDETEGNNPDEYQIMAMAILASGALSPREAIDFINKQKIQSIVFGASRLDHIEEVIKLVKN